ncbi:MAG TPA: hypothetical protein VGJ13_13120 [Pseudonocardiaceae bacterium]|jgi:hypothetical protein
MTDDEAATAAEVINEDWQEHPDLPSDAPSAVAGEMHVRSGAATDGWIPFWPAGEPEPALVDNNRWARTRLVEAKAVAQTLVIAFIWPHDDPRPRTYVMVVDVATWSPDHRLTSSVIWSKLNEIQSIPDWTVSHTRAVSDRVSVLTPFA